jgi:hypothetical protein
MKPETDPIADDEWLLRRVRVERFRTDKTPIISPNAFEPRVKGRDIDHDGISLYREACLNAPADILTTVAEDRRHEYGIVRVPISLLRTLNLSVQFRQDARVLGHVVIPELNAEAYAVDKARFTPIKEQLAAVASEDENIIRRPSGEPGSNDTSAFA